MAGYSTEDRAIFLSYRSLDREFALKIAADLKNAGVRIWMDVLDGALRPGDEWNFSLQDAVDHSVGLIAVLTPEYVQPGSYGRRELLRAVDARKPVFPLLLRRLEPSQYPLEIQGRQHVDFTAWRDEARYGMQLEAVVAVLQAQSPQQVGHVPDLETQYLTRLVAELEGRRGVVEYVQLTAEAAPPTQRPGPHVDDEWGFALLVNDDESPVGKRLQKRETEQRRVALPSIAAALTHHPRLVLLGEPGAGKTTTVRRLARDTARQRLADPHSAPLPLLLSLAEWRDEALPLDFVRARWPFPSDPASRIANGDIFVYLDGLNEMGDAGRDKVDRLRAWLKTTGAPQRLILTCRLNDYDGNLRFDDLPTVVALSMNEEQIMTFARRYLGDVAPAFLNQVLSEDGHPKGADHHEGKETRSLVYLARNPYLLSAFISIYQHSAGELPRNRGALFRGLTRALWERERLRGTPGWRPYDEASAPFAQLAYAMIDTKMAVSVPVDGALQHVPPSLLDAARGANWIETPSGEMRFYHQLTQEYFAALRLLEIGVHGAVGRPAFKDFPSHGETSRVAQSWDQVLIALCGIAREPDRVIRQISETDPYLAGSCLASGVVVSDGLRKEIIADLAVALLAPTKGRIRRIVREWWAVVLLIGIQALVLARSFGWLPRSPAELALERTLTSHWLITVAFYVVLGLGAYLFFPWGWRRLRPDRVPLARAEAAAVALGDIGDGDSVDVLLKAMSSASWLLRYHASEVFADQRLVHAAPRLLELLEHKRAGVREFAIKSLANTGRRELLNHLLPLLRDSHRAVRTETVLALAKFRECRPDVQLALVHALEDSSKDVRGSAAWALGVIGAIQAAPQLVQAVSDRNSDVRQHAVGALGEFGARAPDTAVLVLGQALHDRNGFVRRRAIEALGRIKHPGGASALREVLLDRGTPAGRLVERIKLVISLVLGVIDIDYFPEERAELRQQAASALGEIGGDEAVEALIQALNDGETTFLTERRLSDVVAEALQKIGTPEADVALRMYSAPAQNAT